MNKIFSRKKAQKAHKLILCFLRFFAAIRPFPLRVYPCLVLYFIAALLCSAETDTSRPSIKTYGQKSKPAVIAPKEETPTESDLDEEAIETPGNEDNEPREGLDWSRVRGVNYLPSYAASPRQFWGDFREEIVGIEISRAHRIGFNSFRVFLSYDAFAERPSEFVEDFETLISICRDEGVTLMPVLFDSWGAEYDQAYSLSLDVSSSAKLKSEIRRTTAEVAYKKFLSRPDAYRLDAKNYERLLGLIALKLLPSRLVPETMDPSSPYWVEWTPSPPRDRLSEKDWPRYREFVKTIMEPNREDPIIAAWDLMNEPDSIRIFGERGDARMVYDFLDEMIRATREIRPKQPITIGTAQGWAGARVFMNKLDLISIHLQQQPLSDLVADFREAGKRGKPVVISSIGGNFFPVSEREISDETQREEMRRLYFQLQRERAGFYLWHCVEGESITPWAGLLRRDGSLKPAAEFLKSEFAR